MLDKINKLYTVRNNVVYDSNNIIKYFYCIYWKVTSLIDLNKIKLPDLKKNKKKVISK